MIDRLYGITHGYHPNFMGIEIAEANVHPSNGLMRDLLSLPQGTRVGIEYTRRFDRGLIIDGRKVTITPSAKYYWSKIREICVSCGLEVVYLEDFIAFSEYSKKKFEFDSLQAQLDKEDLPYDKIIATRRALYNAWIETQYLHIIRRENGILDNIARKQPNVVILGRGHGDFLVQSPKVIESHGIKVSSYNTESIDSEYALYRLGLSFGNRKDVIMATLDENSVPNPNVVVERECLIRKYKAVTEGRVTDGMPDYIGTWDTEIPARGLFELYVKNQGRKRGGIIEDTLGSATFSGWVWDKGVGFTKTYIPGSSSKDASSIPVRYQGQGNGRVFRGTYDFLMSDGKIDEGLSFILRKFSRTVRNTKQS